MQIQPSHNRLIQTGNICVQWSFIEYTFAYTIWHLLDVDEATGKIVTGGLDMLPRLNMAINLASHLKAKPALISLLREARKDIQDGLDSRRNAAVHGVSFGDLNSPSVKVEVHRGKGDRSKQDSPTKDLAALGEELAALRKKLTEGLQSLGVYEPARRANMAAKMRAAASEAVSDPSVGS